MTTTIRRMLAAFLAATCGAAVADEGEGTDGAFPEGWYVTPMATHYSPDADRCGTDGKFGFAAALGHRGETASVEIWAQHLEVPYASCTYTYPEPTQTDPDARATVVEPAGELKLNGGGIALLVGPFSAQHWYTRFYGLVSIGVLQRENRVQDDNDDSTIIGDVGAGYLQPLRFWERTFAVRLEARYRYDAQQPPHAREDYDPPVRRGYNDVVFNLGLQVPLSRAPQAPAAAAEPVAVVPVGDSDGDGVADAIDTCPGTEAGATIDATGCALAVAPPAEPTLETAKAGDTIVLRGVNFDSGRATLTANARALLDDVARQLNQRADLKVEIGGHTDGRGDEGYNQSLSERRAQSVRDYLAGQGVDAARLAAVGYGEAQPVDTNETDEGREKNRRVELKVLEQSPQSPTSNPGDAS